MSRFLNRWLGINRSSNRGDRRKQSQRRRLKAETLETRQLLAANLFHNELLPEDVNNDGSVTASDALFVINEMNRQSADGGTPGGRGMMTDVNNDGRHTAVDALMIINRINRERPGAPPRGGNPSGPITPPVNSPVDEGDVEVRSIDGSGNNVDNPDLGTPGQPLLRIADADYADGVSDPAGEDRPSAREISNVLSGVEDAGTKNERGLSAFLYVWGQFLDHDIDLTESQDDGELFPVEVPEGDPLFDPTGSGDATIPLTRSQYDLASGTSVDNPREQISSITAYIDGSQVYGSDQATADSLREFVGGRLTITESGLLPLNESGTVIAGDIRASENLSLTSLHTLFVREHNRLAEEISASDASLTDEEIYQQARARVIAEIQSITYNEFLPALLGKNAISDYQGYDSSVDPTIANEFSTAAFRFGHSTLNDDVGFFDNDGLAVQDEIALKDAFFNSGLLEETGIDSILKYDASSRSQEIDLEVVDSVRNFLFGPPGAGGLDLVALNIQRGRDHGLSDYNATREAYGLDEIDSFDDITSNVELQGKLESLYGHVNNIDLWVGLLAEDHLAGSSVGELTQTIIVDQFERLRDGDRFWYENTLNGREIKAVENTSLADVIERNTTVDSLQSNVFFFTPEISGTVLAVQTPVDRPVNNAPVNNLQAGGRDRNGSGQIRGQQGNPPRNQPPVPVPAAGITVELLSGDGNVIESVVTNSRGDYKFDSFAESGEYQVRIAASNDVFVNGPDTVDVLISSGDIRLNRLNFMITV